MALTKMLISYEKSHIYIYWERDKDDISLFSSYPELLDVHYMRLTQFLVVRLSGQYYMYTV